VIFGMSSSMYDELKVENGRVQQTNFHQYRVVRMNEAPQIDVTLIANGEAPGGIGEPVTALVAPSVSNAVFAITGKRLRKLPLNLA